MARHGVLGAGNNAVTDPGLHRPRGLEGSGDSIKRVSEMRVELQTIASAGKETGSPARSVGA